MHALMTPPSMPPADPPADRQSLSLALGAAFHGGDGWEALAVADRILAEHTPTEEELAMRGEVLRHLKAPWRAVVDLLAARFLAADRGTPEPPFVAGALDALHGALANAGQPGAPGSMPDDVLVAIDQRGRLPRVGRRIIEALAPLPHGQGEAIAGRAAVFALAEEDRMVARAAAEHVLGGYPDHAAMFAIRALAVPPSEEPNDETLELLEEAWRRLVFGPVDAADEQLLELGKACQAISMERIAERRLAALDRRGLDDERAAFAEEAAQAMPWTHRIAHSEPPPSSSIRPVVIAPPPNLPSMATPTGVPALDDKFEGTLSELLNDLAPPPEVSGPPPPPASPVAPHAVRSKPPPPPPAALRRASHDEPD